MSKLPLSTKLIGAIGIVYGDIGTSPLYALKSCFAISNLAVNTENIFGVISIFVWALLIIVSVKYLMIVLNATYKGEGGVLALSSLCTKVAPHYKKFIAVLALLGFALFFGDGVITPAISVLSAVEGISLISDRFSQYVMPISLAILGLLFILQHKGTHTIGSLFGPIMILWFIVLSGLGLYQISMCPNILYALNPYYALKFFIDHGFASFFVLGGAILVITGVEALYADLGHFGSKAMRLGWYCFVFPALLLNYLGQGALLLQHPEAIVHPFFNMAPTIALYPLIILATAATIIASQAVISGMFSLCWQAMMLNYLPKMRVHHTSSQQMGQIYIPIVNWVLACFTVSAVLIFRESANLASAYGFSVSSVMLITTTLTALIFMKTQRVLILYTLGLVATLEIVFFSANIIKIMEGAWYPIAIAAFVFYIMRVWIIGGSVLKKQQYKATQNLTDFLVEYAKTYEQRIPGMAIFMTRYPKKVPHSLLVQLEHNKFLHEKLVFVSIIVSNAPRVHYRSRYSMTKLGKDMYAVSIKYGFQEVPNMQKMLKWSIETSLISDYHDISFFVSRGIPIATSDVALGRIAERVYILLSKLSSSAYEFYHIPFQKVIELGVRYKI